MAPEEFAEVPSLLHIETISQYIALPPSTLGAPHPSACAAFFSPLLLTYYPPVRGIVLSYSNVRLSSSPQPPSQSPSKRRPRTEEEDGSESGSESDSEGQELLMKVVDEYSAVFTWATVDFLVLRPQKNVWLEGMIKSQSESHLQISFLNAFSVSLLRKDLPADWEWVTDSGHYVDVDGNTLKGAIQFRIRDFDLRAKIGASKGILRIEGSLLTEEEEKNRGKDSQPGPKGEQKKKKKDKKQRKTTEQPQNVDAMEVD